MMTDQPSLDMEPPVEGDDEDTPKERQLYRAVVRGLLQRMRSNECAAADVTNAIRFLKNIGFKPENGINRGSEKLFKDIVEGLKHEKLT